MEKERVDKTKSDADLTEKHNADGRTIRQWLAAKRNDRRRYKSRPSNARTRAIEKLVTAFLRSTRRMKKRYEPEWTDAHITNIVKKAKSNAALMTELDKHNADGRAIEEALKRVRNARQVCV
ncbi:hypothetical protein WR25_02648 [Diploscapter pachys]|uniref:Uncharacterized protein n=1 Tax=Diploscapter pachys TaxID=2018661 RepID=A0A2A2KEV2_9BILA|nr:hypothetical protein WR25_02648 [Diploscapter pachys]